MSKYNQSYMKLKNAETEKATHSLVSILIGIVIIISAVALFQHWFKPHDIRTDVAILSNTGY